MIHRTDLPNPIIEWPDVRITMSDGVTLSARIWMPADADTKPVPAILEHLPYRKRDGTIARDELTHPYFAGHGYACIRVDMRGNGDSEGLMEDEYTQQEWDDAIAVMDWVRAQPWCNGIWGMMGISWGGFNGLQVAALEPEGLKAVISLCTTSDRYADDIHYKGGCMLGENLGWAAQMLAYSSRPPDPDVVGDKWREMWLGRLKAQPFLLETWLDHQTRDAYWESGSICEDWSSIKAAVLVIGGWHDGYRNTPATVVENLTAPAKAIVGPWIHKYPHFAAPEPRIGFLQEALRWWDQWLKGENTNVKADPNQRLWLMDGIGPERYVTERPGRWVGIDTPLENTTLHLAGKTLAEDPAPVDADINSPPHCGSGTGEYFPCNFGPEFPGEQSEDDAMSVCFDGAVANEPFDIIGAPKAQLAVIPQASCGQLAIRLCDVSQDGTSVLISHGFLNLQHHMSHANPRPLKPGRQIEVKLALDQCAYRLPKGHHLRLAISNAYWPFIWPSSETSAVKITGGELHLPLRPQTEDQNISFDTPEAAPPWNVTTLRESSMFRHTDTEDDGTVTTTIQIDDGRVQDNNHGLITESICQESWSIHPDNPLSALGYYNWETKMERGDWIIRTRCQASLSADKNHWKPRAKIEAWENDEKVFEKSFRRDIERNGI